MKTQKAILDGKEIEVVIELDEGLMKDEILLDKNSDDTLDLSNLKQDIKKNLENTQELEVNNNE